jgi:hypothetical protein
MNDPRYIYRVNGNETGVWVEVAIYDPDRYDGAGGARFGFDAQATLTENWNERDRLVAEVTQGSIGNTSPDEGALRVDVYAQAVEIARYMQHHADCGSTPVAIAHDLKTLLRAGKPTERLDLGKVLA